ncbi:hypothetical protein SK128_020861, partial [Halocaridina rubra]
MVSNLLEVRGMVRSPSGCSEVSSIRSGVRGGGASGGFSKGLGNLLLNDAVIEKNQLQQDGSQFSVGVNGMSTKERFPAITESELEGVPEEYASAKIAGSMSVGEKKKDTKSTNFEVNSTGLQLHTMATCLACYSLVPPSPQQSTSSFLECENDSIMVNSVTESPPLPRVKAISEASEASESSSVNSQGWDEPGEGKPGSQKLNQTLIRKEILRFINNLLSSIAAKSSES